MEGLKVWQSGRCEGYTCHTVENIGKRKAFLLVETEDAAEATHATHVKPGSESDGMPLLIMDRDLFKRISTSSRPWYKLVPITPVEPTPEEKAAAEKEAAWDQFKIDMVLPVTKDSYTYAAFCKVYDAAIAAKK